MIQFLILKLCTEKIKEKEQLSEVLQQPSVEHHKVPVRQRGPRGHQPVVDVDDGRREER